MSSCRLAYLGCSEGDASPSSRDLVCPGGQVNATAWPRPPSRTAAATNTMDTASVSVVTASDSHDLGCHGGNLGSSSCDLSRHCQRAPTPSPKPRPPSKISLTRTTTETASASTITASDTSRATAT